MQRPPYDSPGMRALIDFMASLAIIVHPAWIPITPMPVPACGATDGFLAAELTRLGRTLDDLISEA